jgi:hypothetical protein
MRIKSLATAVAIVTLVAGALFLTRGAGSFSRLTTLTGLYAVEDVGGWSVVCFVNRDSGATSCLPEAAVKKEDAL